MSKKKVIKPVKLAIDNYEGRNPADLFATDLLFNPDNYRFAQATGRFALERIDFHDPHGIMAEFGNMPAIRATNHDDFTNPVALGRAYTHGGFANPRYAAMAELFDERHPHVARFIGSLGGYPVDRARFARGDKAVVRQFLDISKYILEELGQPIDIFPEGQISKESISGVIGEVNTGATNIARRSGVPTIILGQVGMRGAIPKAFIPFHKTWGVIVAHDVIMPEEKIKPEQLRQKLQTARNFAMHIQWDR